MILFVDNNRGILFIGGLVGDFIKITAIGISELIKQIMGIGNDCHL